MAPAQQRRTYLNKKTILIGFAAIFAIGLFALYKTSILGRASGELETQLVLAKREGLPLDANDLKEQDRVPADDNAAPCLQQAISKLTDWEKTSNGKAFTKVVHQSGGIGIITPEQLDSLQPALADLAPVFKLLTVASLKRRVDFQRHWELGPALMFPELAEEKLGISALLLRAKTEIGKGDLEAGLGTASIAARLSTLEGQDPIIIGLLIQVSSRVQICDLLAHIIRNHSADRAALERCREILVDLGSQPDVRAAIRHEFVMGRLGINSLGTARGAEEEGFQSGDTAIKLARLPVVRTAYELRFVQVYRNLYRGLSENPGSVSSMRRAFQAVDMELNSKSSSDWSYGLAAILAPVFSQAAIVIGESEARRNVLLAALDVLEAKIKTGRFPSVGLTSSGYWLDPFTGKPLIYRHKPDGFLVYSVGQDLKDDGGKPRPKNYGGESYDIPFEFPHERPREEPVKTTQRADRPPSGSVESRLSSH